MQSAGFLGETIVTYLQLITVLTAPMMLIACGGGSPVNSAGSVRAAGDVELSAVVNALKCELSETLTNGSYIGALVTDKVEAKLTLSNVVTRKVAGEGGIEFKVIGLGVEGTGGGSQSRERGNELEFSFSYANLRNGLAIPAFCAELDRSVIVRNSPIAAILEGLRAEYAKIVRTEPRVQLGTIDYSASFDVTREVEGGATVSVLIFKVGGTGTKTVSRSQKLTLTFDMSVLPPVTPM